MQPKNYIAPYVAIKSELLFIRKRENQRNKPQQNVTEINDSQYTACETSHVSKAKRLA